MTVTLPTDELNELFNHVSHGMSDQVTIDIDASTLYVPSVDQSFSVSIKAAHRRAFLDGTWDELSLLKVNDDKINQLASTLPYFQW